MKAIRPASAPLIPILLIVLGFVLLGASVTAQDLSPEQKAKLQGAESQLRGAEGDLEAARGSAGTPANPAKGSRKRLTAMRVTSARPKLDQAATWIGELPATNAEVAALEKRLDAARKLADEIDGILSGAGVPAPEPATPAPTPEKKEPAPAAEPKPVPAGEPAEKRVPVAAPEKTPRLDYRQEEALKRAQYNLREAQGLGGKVGEIVKRIDGEGEKPVHSEVKHALETLARAEQKHGYAMKELPALPADNPQVAETVEAARSCGDLLGAYRSRLEGESAKLQKVSGMENYPRYEDDMDLMRDFSRRYSNWQQIVQQPEELAKVIAEDGDCVKEIQRIAKTYQPLIDQKTKEGAALEKLGLYCLEKRKGFTARLDAYRKELPGLFDGHVAEAEKISEEAVAEKKPLFFGPNGGIEQTLGFAEQKLIVLRAFGDDVAKPCEQKLTAARDRIAARARSLEAEIIAQNRLPSDRYRGADRDDLIKRATACWQEVEPGAKVLTARIPGEAWVRSTRWEWSAGAFHKVDKSKIQVQLVLQHDDKLAVIRPVNLYKYHLENDVIRAYRYDKREDSLLPTRFIPLAKLK